MKRFDPMAFGDEALERADGDGVVHAPSPARIFARGRADPPADRSKGVGLAGDPVGALFLAGGDGQDIRTGVRADRAGRLAADSALIVGKVGEFDPIGHGRVYGSLLVTHGYRVDGRCRSGRWGRGAGRTRESQRNQPGESPVGKVSHWRLQC